MNGTIGELLAAVCRRFGQRPALVRGDQARTYSELLERGRGWPTRCGPRSPATSGRSGALRGGAAAQRELEGAQGPGAGRTGPAGAAAGYHGGVAGRAGAGFRSAGGGRAGCAGAGRSSGGGPDPAPAYGGDLAGAGRRGGAGADRQRRRGQADRGGAGLQSGDVDVAEFAEAFAALCLRFRRDLDAGPERMNPNGGTIAMGHAFGATGGDPAGLRGGRARATRRTVRRGRGQRGGGARGSRARRAHRVMTAARRDGNSAGALAGRVAVVSGAGGGWAVVLPGAGQPARPAERRVRGHGRRAAAARVGGGVGHGDAAGRARPEPRAAGELLAESGRGEPREFRVSADASGGFRG